MKVWTKILAHLREISLKEGAPVGLEETVTELKGLAAERVLEYVYMQTDLTDRESGPELILTLGFYTGYTGRCAYDSWTFELQPLFSTKGCLIRGKKNFATVQGGRLRQEVCKLTVKSPKANPKAKATAQKKRAL